MGHSTIDEKSPVAVSRLSAARAAQAGVPRRVLVVDDNFDAAMTLDALLRSLGHETVTAYDGAQALKTAGDFTPDVVLLDIGCRTLTATK